MIPFLITVIVLCLCTIAYLFMVINTADPVHDDYYEGKIKQLEIDLAQARYDKAAIAKIDRRKDRTIAGLEGENTKLRDEVDQFKKQVVDLQMHLEGNTETA